MRLISCWLVLVLLFSVRSAPAAGFEEIPPISEAQRSEVYEVAANGKPLFVQRCDGRSESSSYVHGVLNGSATFTVTCRQAKGKWNVASASPVNVQQGSDTVTITLNEPAKLLIQTGAAEQVYLFVDAPEKQRPDVNSPAVISAADRGIDATGKSLVTGAIQKAIDELAARPGGGTLYFPPGIYRTGTIQVKSRVQIYLAAGARLQGSRDPADYPFDPGTKETPDRTQDIRSRLILFDGAEDASLCGLGEIDGEGPVIRGEHKRVPNLVRVRRSRNIRIEGVLLRRAAGWNTHVFHSDHVTVRDIKIISSWSDGLDLDNSRNVTVENVLLASHDDSFVVKATGFDQHADRVGDLALRGAVLWTQKSALKIGTETLADVMENMTFERVAITGGRGGLVILLRDGALIRNVTYDRIRIGEVGTALDWNIQKRQGLGRIEDVTVSNVDVTDFSPSSFQGYDKEHAIRRIRFTNFRAASHLILAAKDGNIGKNPHVYELSFAAGGATATSRPAGH